MDRKRLIRICVAVSVIGVVVAVVVLPWRTVATMPASVHIGGQVFHPPQLGTRLYAMGRPFYLVGLLTLAALAAGGSLVLDRGRWPSRVIFASGVGIVMLVLLVQQSAATDGYLGGGQIQPGNTVALASGLIVTLAATWWMFLRTRPSTQPAAT